MLPWSAPGKFSCIKQILTIFHEVSIDYDAQCLRFEVASCLLEPETTPVVHALD